jgi:Icc-related predicted phosphoesterase
VIAGNDPSEVMLGKTLVISPGRLELGSYSVVDLHTLAVERRQFEMVR